MVESKSPQQNSYSRITTMGYIHSKIFSYAALKLPMIRGL